MDKIMTDKIMAEIEKDHFDLYEKALAVMDVCKKEVIRQLDKLTVMGVMEMLPILEKIMKPHNISNMAKNYYLWTECETLVEAQLQHTTKQLMDLIGG